MYCDRLRCGTKNIFSKICKVVLIYKEPCFQPHPHLDSFLWVLNFDKTRDRKLAKVSDIHLEHTHENVCNIWAYIFSHIVSTVFLRIAALDFVATVRRTLMLHSSKNTYDPSSDGFGLQQNPSMSQIVNQIPFDFLIIEIQQWES